MGLLRWISEQREKLILGPAYSQLDPDEDVIQWARAREPNSRREGFVYLTSRQIIVRWTGRDDGHHAIPWDEIEAWGVNTDLPRGPTLAIETDEFALVVQMPVLTHATAAEVERFLRRFVHLSPEPRRPLQRVAQAVSGRWGTEAPSEVSKSKRTPAEHTKRLLITLLGLVMVVGGMVITPLPGPWSFPIVLGGLAVLSSEYDWAKDALQWTRRQYQQAKQKVRERRSAGRSPTARPTEEHK